MGIKDSLQYKLFLPQSVLLKNNHLVQAKKQQLQEVLDIINNLREEKIVTIGIVYIYKK